MNTQPSAAYQRALFGAAAALIGVLALYAGLVMTLVAITVWHGMAHLDWLRSGTGGFLLYGTPIFIGAVLTLFLVRPVFARQPPPPPSRAISHEEHPRLFQFIGAICRRSRQQAAWPISISSRRNCRVNVIP